MKNLKLWALVVSALSAASTAYAGVIITQTGRVLDGADKPLTNAVLKIDFWNVKLLGESLWNETYNVTPDADGVYVLAIGDNVGTGKQALPESIFGGGTTYIEVTLNTVVLTPDLLT